MRTKRKAAKKIAARELLAEAYTDEVMSRVRRMSLDVYYLRQMDHLLARKALKVFGKADRAAIWLTTPLKQLWGKTPRECRKQDVLQVLGRMENGVFG